MKKLLTCSLLTFALLTNTYSAEACSRVTYTTTSGNVVTGRTMDWESKDVPSLNITKRGTINVSSAKINPVKWTSKYGTVNIKSGISTNSGINEKGLEGDVLWLGESDYGSIKDGEYGIAVTEYLQYMLDNFATVDEVVDFVKSNTIRPVVSPRDYAKKLAIQLHYIFTDKTGNNVIIEYLNGEVSVHEIKGRVVLTNDPSYEKMCVLRDYYKEIGILNNMPGSSLSQARFLYATGWVEDFTNKKLPGYIKGIENQDLNTQAIMSVLSLMRGVSTPLGVELTAAEPNNTSTLWRTVIDVKNNKLIFDSALAMVTIEVDVNKIDFTKDYEPINLSAGCKLHGDITDIILKK